MIRRASTFNSGRIDHLYKDPHEPGARLFLHYGDLSNSEQLTNLVYNIQPEEVYHLGAQSHVLVSFEMPEYTGDVTGIGSTRILEALWRSGSSARFYQASSSEMFGNAPAPQNENTIFQPRSPYSAAKLYAYWLAVTYRDGYGLFACNGVLFNHESPRRGETFLTHKVTRAVARIKAGQQNKLYLGNLDARRDWGYAPEYVEAMWLMLQQDQGDDYVIGTGEAHTVREFVEEAFTYADLDWNEFVEFDSRYLRPTEVDYLKADASKAKKKLGWEAKVNFRELAAIMVDADLEAIGLLPVGYGKRLLETKFSDWHQWPSAVTSTIQNGQKGFE